MVGHTELSPIGSETLPIRDRRSNLTGQLPHFLLPKGEKVQ